MKRGRQEEFAASSVEPISLLQGKNSNPVDSSKRIFLMNFQQQDVLNEKNKSIFFYTFMVYSLNKSNLLNPFFMIAEVLQVKKNKEEMIMKIENITNLGGKISTQKFTFLHSFYKHMEALKKFTDHLYGR